MEDMKRLELIKKVIELLSDQLGVKSEKIEMNSKIINDLGADSIDVIELIMLTEEVFDIEITDEEAEKVKTVRDMVDVLSIKLEG